MSSKLTPQEAASRATDFSNTEDRDVKQFLKVATANELWEFIQRVSIYNNNLWLPRARAAIEYRLAYESAELAKQLTEQNAILVKESRALTKYTKGLYVLTFALVGFAIVQIVIMVIDYFKHG